VLMHPALSRKRAKMLAGEKEDLEARCREIRAWVCRMIGEVGVGHVGGSLSVVEAVVTLYRRHLRVDPTMPQKPDRDRFVLSKGHSGPTLYAVLALEGFFPISELVTLNQPGTSLPSHPVSWKTPGVDMTTGSLGQGFSAAVGIAAGQAMRGSDARVYAIAGDGECQEGQIWEAALLGAHQKLGNLIGFVDDNDANLDGPASAINRLEPLGEKWKAFGWRTVEIDGHDVEAVDDAIAEAKAYAVGPSMIVLHTRKGCGVSYFEKLGYASHSVPVDHDLMTKALAELGWRPTRDGIEPLVQAITLSREG
jgi:transketolase